MGWNLPPGCTTRDIDDAAGVNDPKWGFADAFCEQINPLEEWVWKQISDAYAKGYQAGRSDEAEAQRAREYDK